VFTARYALSPYITQIRFFFKGVKSVQFVWGWTIRSLLYIMSNERTRVRVSNYQLNAQFLYSITIYMLHYNPRHVSSSTLLTFRRSNCPTTYQTRQFFNNFTTNEDIATKFEADLPQCVRNVTTS